MLSATLWVALHCDKVCTTNARKNCFDFAHTTTLVPRQTPRVAHNLPGIYH